MVSCIRGTVRRTYVHSCEERCHITPVEAARSYTTDCSILDSGRSVFSSSAPKWTGAGVILPYCRWRCDQRSDLLPNPMNDPVFLSPSLQLFFVLFFSFLSAFMGWRFAWHGEMWMWRRGGIILTSNSLSVLNDLYQFSFIPPSRWVFHLQGDRIYCSLSLDRTLFRSTDYYGHPVMDLTVARNSTHPIRLVTILGNVACQKLMTDNAHNPPSCTLFVYDLNFTFPAYRNLVCTCRENFRIKSSTQLSLFFQNFFLPSFALFSFLVFLTTQSRALWGGTGY